MTIDDRLEALTMNMELAWRELEAHRILIEEQDQRTERRMDKVLTIVEKLATITESHERRLSHFEGDGR